LIIKTTRLTPQSTLDGFSKQRSHDKTWKVKPNMI